MSDIYESDLLYGYGDSDGILMQASKLDTIDEIRSTLRPYYDLLVRVYEDELLPIDEDYRTGHDTYGYKDLESISDTLYYISDKYKVSFRIRWLIDLINPNYNLWDGQLSNKGA